MRKKLSGSWSLLGATALAALLLTITHPSPEGILTLGLGDREVRAAPGAPPQAKRHELTRLDVVSQTLFRIRDSYVDPSRIDPKEMLYAALDSVEYNIPEVLVENNRARDEIVVVVNDQQRTFSAADVNSPWRLTKHLKMIFRFMEKNMNSGADLAKIEYAAVNGMLGTLDPHSVLLDPEMAAEMDAATDGEFGGLGIVVSMRDKKLTVVRPMDNTPASKAGIKARDHIVKINDEVTENLTLNEAVSRMRGAAGTSVVLWIERKGETDVLDFKLVRKRIQLDTVEARLLSNNVGYLKVNSFAGNTTSEVQAELKRLTAKGAKAWIVDLRWNPGGLLEQAIELSNLFVERGTIVTTVTGAQRESHRALTEGTYKSNPIAVLVNSGSASASEIVAGALKNLDRAVIVGSTTFGKGSVQLLYDNKDGTKLKLTIAQYLTPGDISIQSLGVRPDIELRRMLVPKKNDKPSDYLRLLASKNKRGEKDLKSHLSSNYAVKSEKPFAEVSFVYDQAKSSHGQDAANPLEAEAQEPIDDGFREDFEIRFTKELLSSAGKKTRTQTLKGTKKFLAKIRDAEENKLVGRLSKLGIDWSSASVPKTNLHAHFAIVGKTGRLTAGDVIQVRGSIKNTGNDTAYRVHARAQSEDKVFDELEQVFGKLLPGEERTWLTHVKLPDAARDRVSHVEFDVIAANSGEVLANPLKIRVKAANRPVFAYHHQLLDDSNGDGLVQSGERYRLRVEIKNVGVGTAKDASAILRNASGNNLTLRRARFELGEMKPGDKRTVEFAFQTRQQTSAKKASVEMTVYDAKLGESVSEKLHYPILKSSPGPARAKGSLQFAANNTPLFEGASLSSARVANAPRSAVLQITGMLQSWYRVALADGRPAFVPRNAATAVQKKTNATRVSSHWQVTPPRLDLEIPSLETDKSSYSLRGQARDDNHIEDVYVYVSNGTAKIDNQKVFYRSNRGSGTGREMHFNATIPLWPGSNTVSVVARENDVVRTRRTFIVYRSGGTTTAALPRNH